MAYSDHTNTRPENMYTRGYSEIVMRSEKHRSTGRSTVSLRDIPGVGQKIDDYTRDDIKGNYHASVKVQPNHE